MIHNRSVLILAVLLGLAVGGCGGDDDDDEGNAAATLESCKQLCDAQVAASCGLVLPADTCKQFCDVYSETPPACQSAAKASSDCQLRQEDVCDTSGCQAEEAAFNQACM